MGLCDLLSAPDAVLTIMPEAGRFRFTLRLTPKGGRDQIDGWSEDADGRPVLKARVCAVPEDGKANAALISLLAKTLRVPKSAVVIVSGTTARQKQIEITGDCASLATRLQAPSALRIAAS